MNRPIYECTLFTRTFSLRSDFYIFPLSPSGRKATPPPPDGPNQQKSSAKTFFLDLDRKKKMGKAQKEIKPIHQLGLHRKEYFFNHMNSTNTEWKKGNIFAASVLWVRDWILNMHRYFLIVSFLIKQVFSYLLDSNPSWKTAGQTNCFSTGFSW